MPAPSTSVRRSMGDGVALNSICSVRLLASRPIGRTLLGSTGVRQGALDAIEVLMDPARRSGLPASPRTATNCACATSADSTLASGFGREVRRAETRFEPHRASPSARLSGVAPRPDHDCAVQRSGQTSRNREPCPPDRRSYCAYSRLASDLVFPFWTAAPPTTRRLPPIWGRRWRGRSFFGSNHDMRTGEQCRARCLCATTA